MFGGKFLVEILQYPASMKPKQDCIWSALWKHGWILLKLGMHVRIVCGIIETEIRVTGKSKNPQK